jgi:hypothetical protein
VKKKMSGEEHKHEWVPCNFAILEDKEGNWIVVHFICKSCDEEKTLIGKLKDVE